MNLAHFALQKLRILPSTLLSMSNRERSFVYASILLRADEERKLASEMKR